MLDKLQVYFQLRDALFEVLKLIHSREDSYHKLIGLILALKSEK